MGGKWDACRAWVIVAAMQAANVLPSSVTSILLKPLTRATSAHHTDQVMFLVNNMRENMDEVLLLGGGGMHPGRQVC